MREHLSKIKAVFADVDNTLLCIKLRDYDGKRAVGFLEYNDWLEYNIRMNAYEHCTAPKGMFNIINYLHQKWSKNLWFDRMYK